MILSYQIAQMALGKVASIRLAVNLPRPDRKRAREGCVELEHAIPTLLEQLGRGGAYEAFHPRIEEIGADIQQLRRLLEGPDTTTINGLLTSIEQKVQALAAEPVVA